MALTLESILFYLIVLDSIGANLTSWFGQKWYKKNFRIFSRYFPASRGWTAIYLILVIWIGLALYRLGIIP